MMKKLVVFCLVICMALSLAGCTQKVDDTPRSEDGRIILTLAVSPGANSQVLRAVDEYNRDNETYKIEVIENEYVGIVVADMYHFDSYELFIRSDYENAFIDLYPYLDADEVYSRESLLPNLLSAMEMQGKLYALPRTFLIEAFMIDADLPTENLTVYNVREVAGDEPPFQRWRMGEEVLSLMLPCLVGPRVDESTATCDFTDPEFAEILQLCFEHNSITRDVTDYEYQSEGLLYATWISRPTNYFTENDPERQWQITNALDGKSNGAYFDLRSCFTISTFCKYPDAAWGFIRTMLYQDATNFDHGFPSTFEGLDTLKEWISMSNVATEQNVTDTYEFIESVHYLDNRYFDLEMIVRSEADDYFIGYQSLEEAVSDIQARAQAYMTIHYGRK